MGPPKWRVGSLRGVLQICHPQHELNYKTNHWIQSLHIQELLIKISLFSSLLKSSLKKPYVLINK
jgi:hypothetical protein